MTPQAVRGQTTCCTKSRTRQKRAIAAPPDPENDGPTSMRMRAASATFRCLRCRLLSLILVGGRFVFAFALVWIRIVLVVMTSTAPASTVPLGAVTIAAGSPLF